jgi:hypothetical protein
MCPVHKPPTSLHSINCVERATEKVDPENGKVRVKIVMETCLKTALSKSRPPPHKGFCIIRLI